MSENVFLSWYYGYVRYFRRLSIEKYEKDLWKKLAYVARYGNQPLSELINIETRALDLFAYALNEIVAEENKAGHRT